MTPPRAASPPSQPRMPGSAGSHGDDDQQQEAPDEGRPGPQRRGGRLWEVGVRRLEVPVDDVVVQLARARRVARTGTRAGRAGRGMRGAGASPRLGARRLRWGIGAVGPQGVIGGVIRAVIGGVVPGGARSHAAARGVRRTRRRLVRSLQDAAPCPRPRACGRTRRRRRADRGRCPAPGSSSVSRSAGDMLLEEPRRGLEKSLGVVIQGGEVIAPGEREPFDAAAHPGRDMEIAVRRRDRVVLARRGQQQRGRDVAQTSAGAAEQPAQLADGARRVRS